MHDLESILAVDSSFDKTRSQRVEALSHLNVHLQDVNLMGKPVEQGAGQSLRAKDLGPFLLRSVRNTPDTLLDAIQPQDGKLRPTEKAVLRPQVMTSPATCSQKRN